MKNIIIFVLILLLAFFLRIYNLNSLPPSLNWDEVSLGYNAYSILETGRDEWGIFLPLSFRAYGEYKLPVYVYLDVPFVKIFGLNEWGVRFPSVLAGVGFIILVFLILKELTKKWDVSLWGMLVASILPWVLNLSRIAVEANLALFLTTAAFYFFVKGLNANKFLILSFLIWGLTIFTYNSSRIFTPLFLTILTLVFWKDLIKNKKIFIFASAIFVIFFSVALIKGLSEDSIVRFQWTSILNQVGTNEINKLRGESFLPSNLSRLVYNKATYWVSNASTNYLNHFSPRFLFINGGSNYQYNPIGEGLILVVLAPFLLFGLIATLRKRNKWGTIFLIWLFLAPIPSSITRDSPHTLRSLMMITPLIFFISMGISVCFNLIKKWQKLAAVTLVLILGINFYFFWQNYSENYIKNYSWAFQYGYKETVQFIKDHYSEYDQIIITKKQGEPHEFVLFYFAWSPSKYQEDTNLIRYLQSNWYWVDRFDKFIYVNDWDIPKDANGKWKMERGGQFKISQKALLITSPGNYPSSWKKLKTVYYLDSKPAFDIVELARVQYK